MTGTIIKGIGGFYYVLLPDGTVGEYRARGKFRKAGITPMVGDRVVTNDRDQEENWITEILPRKNSLIRPAVANIDTLIIVLSASNPAPDYFLADKLILHACADRIRPVLVLNKCDEASPKSLEAFDRSFPKEFESVKVSAKTGLGLDALRSILSGRITCFSGQSAVGKSSLLNALIPGLHMETGELSLKTERGKHTTRHAELIPFEGGAVLDTPGFSLLDPPELSGELMELCYPEFRDYSAQCRFPQCTHIAEPGCAVKEALRCGDVPSDRYNRYVLLKKEELERMKHRYD